VSEPQIPTFIQNVEAFANTFGPHEAPMVIDFAHLPWLTSTHRDEFIKLLTEPGGASA